ncbi:MBL fold metallo-hydrolase [Patescibacteria group bacterium]|nr:MBL fold metallo-hydrolase [Patescibacteria group bacterium]MBU1755312.1 MBL fold metallo-hydrolase [Patescibacteria group bacterium]
MKKTTPLALLALVTISAFNILIAIQLLAPIKHELTVSFLDIGQGDSIFIESPTGVQLLIDGGPDRSVLRELPKRMGIFDRSIDVVLATHPDKDHIAGLTEVFNRYAVGTYVESGVEGDSSYVDSLAAAVTSERVNTILAKRGMRLHLGGGAYADILYPDRDVTNLETNTASIVVRVVYGESEFLLTGDAPISVEDWLVDLDGEHLASDVLKAGHHGSRTSTSEEWITAVHPQYVVISAGEDNSYGHPHTEVVDRIRERGARMLSTATDGTVTFTSDGQVLTVR